jgi:hypothetical protein
MTDRARAIDAVDVLNDFIGDFVTGAMVLREYSRQHNENKLLLEQMIPIQKMCISYVVLAFAKFEEFWEHYHDFVPLENRDACKAVLKVVRIRKITEFRNRAVGHIWDRKTGRPLKHSEIMSAIAAIATPDLAAFLDWVNNPAINAGTSTVVSLIETIRDSIALKHNIEPDEIVRR